MSLIGYALKRTSKKQRKLNRKRRGKFYISRYNMESEERTATITPEEMISTKMSETKLLKSKGIKCGLLSTNPVGTITETKCYKTGNIKIKQRIDSPVS